VRPLALAAILSLGSATALAQPPSKAEAAPPIRSGDAALTYQAVRTNTQPGDCGCFFLNGGGLSGSVDFHPKWAAVAEVSGGYSGNGPSTGNSLTLLSFMGGARYRLRPLPSAPSDHPHRLSPFAQALAGVARAGGGIAGEGDHNTAFAARIGGGLDIPLTPRFSLRAIQADYFLTSFANGSNSHQNNLLLAAGLVYRWSR
jgi:outer membrane immunogenic protein